MVRKQKLCSKCGKPRVIWKNHGGLRYCQQCWGAQYKPMSIPSVKQKPIAHRSSKRSREELEYSKKRIIFLNEHPMCEAHIAGVCTGTSSEIHHKAGRIGKLLLDIRYWLSTCRSCHQFIEMNPKAAREMGLSTTRLDK